jgi:hypothetical protein
MALQNANNSNAQLLKAKINNLHQIFSLFMAIFRGLVLNMGIVRSCQKEDTWSHTRPTNPLHFRLPGKKKPRRLVLGLVLRAWQFPTFAWQTATLSSALSGFTSEFGMGSGGSRSLWSPSKLVSSTAFQLSTVFGVCLMHTVGNL